MGMSKLVFIAMLGVETDVVLLLKLKIAHNIIPDDSVSMLDNR